MPRLTHVVVAALIATAFFVPGVSADHDVDSLARTAILEACLPAWDPFEPRILTWDGRTLHDEPLKVKALFWGTWQLSQLATPGQPTQAELDGGQHLRRWRWEYECLHPAPIVVVHDPPPPVKDVKTSKSVPTISPTPEPTPSPTVAPTISPTPEPTPEPTPSPTVAPTISPTPEPTPEPTPSPTVAPTISPTPEPTPEPTPSPTVAPTISPTPEPTPEPTPTLETTPVVTPVVTPIPSPTPAPTPPPPPAPTCTAEFAVGELAGTIPFRAVEAHCVDVDVVVRHPVPSVGTAPERYEQSVRFPLSLNRMIVTFEGGWHVELRRS